MSDLLLLRTGDHLLLRAGDRLVVRAGGGGGSFPFWAAMTNEVPGVTLMRKNTAGQSVAFQMVSTTDGSNVTSGTPTVYVTIDNGTQSTGSGTSTHKGNGQWSYTPTQAETNGDHVAFTMVLSGAVSQPVNVYPVSFDPTDSVRLGLAALPNAAADAAGGLAISDAGGLDLDGLNTTVGTINSNVTTVDTVVDAIKVVTDAIPDSGAMTSIATAAALAVVDGNVDAILVDTGTTLPATLATIAGYIDTEVTAIQVVTDKLDTALELDGAVYRFTTNALEQAPSGGGGGSGDATEAKQDTIIAALAVVDGIVDAILVDTDATIPAHLTDIKGSTFVGSTDSLEAIRNRGDAAWSAAGSSPLTIQTTTIGTLTSQTVFTLAEGSSDDDAYNGLTIIIEDSVTAEQKAVGTIDDYIGSTKTVTLRVDPDVFTIAAGDTITIVATVNGAVAGSATGVGWLG